MRGPVTLVIVAFLTTIVAGCRTPPRKDLVEAELRVKDQDLRELRSTLERTEAYTQSLQRELHAFQQMTPNAGVSEIATPAGVRSVVLGRQTGGIDEDGIPGDEALQVILEPRDADNHTIKAPGIAHLHALEVTPEGLKKPLGTWHVDAETLRKGWRTGLLSTGYYLTLPWRTWPANTKVRVVAQLVGQDERLFEADKDLTIRLTPDAHRKGPPPAEGPPAYEGHPPVEGPPLPSLPREGDILPPPRKVEPNGKEVKSEKQFTAVSYGDPDHPLKGAVELLRPVAASED